MVVGLLLCTESWAGSYDEPIACSVGGRIVLQLRGDCLKAGGQPIKRKKREAATVKRHLTVTDKFGITHEPTFACRSQGPFWMLATNSQENRAHLAQAYLTQGKCTRLALNTEFNVLSRESGLAHIRVESKGNLWVAEGLRVPEIQSPRLSEYRLQPEADLKDETPGLTPEERKQVEEMLSGRESVYRGSSYRGFAQITLVGWSPFLGGSNSAHPSHDGKGRDRCARVSVRYDGSGSRLISPGDFEATFEKGQTRTGQRLLGSIRLSKGESGRGIVCFGGNFMTSITGLRIR
jgi:hypothetical protein